jgi:methionyl-tRNA formyltransferase
VPDAALDRAVLDRAALPGCPLLTRLAFLGTPQVAAATLASLLDAGHEVALVVTRADRRRARNAVPEPSPVKAVALERGIPVSGRVADVIDAGVGLGVVVAFGQLVRPEVLERVPMVNVHFSLLPRWRGAAPVERAILAGDETTGVCLMALEEGLDTGPVYARRETPISQDETAAALRRRLGEIGTSMLLELLARWPDAGEPQPQQGEPTYAAKLRPDELELDWSRPATEVERVVRVGRAWTTFRRRRLIVHRARRVAWEAGDEVPLLGTLPAEELLPGSLVGSLVITGRRGDGAGQALQLVQVQAEGRAVQRFEDWARGARPAPGERLGDR